MAESAQIKKDKLALLLLFCFLAVFPLGQLLRMDFIVAGTRVTLLLVDVIAGLIVLSAIKRITKLLPSFKFFLGFLALNVFSLFLSLRYFSSSQVLIGSLYFFRLTVYLLLFPVIHHLVKHQPKLRPLFANSLIAVSVSIAVLGWIQYFLIPDVRPLIYLGWDDHLYRLVGTFLDPVFTGILIAFGAILSMQTYLKSKNKAFLAVFLLLMTSVAFSYSRAALLALSIGIASSGVVFRRIGLGIAFTFLLALVLFALPRPSSQGVRLERTHSVFSRFTNYKETFQIVKEAPLFGVGYNNICWARNRFLEQENPLSHSCSGSDSSLLLIWATTGTVGLMLFLQAINSLLKNMRVSFWGTAFKALSLALLVHSFFANSLFYPWVLGYMAILGGLGLKFTEKSEE